MSPSRQPYYADDLAYVHHAGFSDFSRMTAPAILRELLAAGIRNGHIVELGCGSGVLARTLTSTGYSVVGIDASPSMLRIARTVAPRARFERGAIGSVRLPTCDAVISVGEGIGYLPPAARRPPSLRPLFAKVARALRPGGLFIFDLLVDEGSRPPSYRTWHAGDDWAVLVDAQQQSGILVRRITTFRARKGGYRQSEERHVAGVFRRLDVLRWMGAEGFSARTRRRYGSAAPLLPGRLAFIARLRK